MALKSEPLPSVLKARVFVREIPAIQTVTQSSDFLEWGFGRQKRVTNGVLPETDPGLGAGLAIGVYLNAQTDRTCNAGLY